MPNAAGFGSRLLLAGHGIFLHNRGVGFGHAQAIRVTGDGLLAGPADPRSMDGAFAGRQREAREMAGAWSLRSVRNPASMRNTRFRAAGWVLLTAGLL